MKTVKIKFSGMYPGFEPDWSDIYNIMVKHYDVQIVDDPDYIICDIFGTPYEYCQYPQVRILTNGENYIPDFNVVDYAISRYPVTLQDRNFYLPGCIGRMERWTALPQKDRNYPETILQEKPYFANFIASHDSEYNIRGDFFKKLCGYKRVESPGTYLYNMPGDVKVQWSQNSKIEFQRKCKFTLCFESTKHEGFITEKIADAFFSDTIPVYYGSDNVTDIFNPKAFINCSDYASFEEVMERIKELDQDDEKYLEMLRQPIFVDPDYPQRLLDDLEAYICHIFDQPLEQAYRRSRVFHAKRYDDFLQEANENRKKRDNSLAKKTRMLAHKLIKG